MKAKRKILIETIKNSYIYCWLYFLFERCPILTISLFYYFSLFLSTSNRILLLLTLVYAFVLYKHLKELKQSLWLVFIATLPFAKGKALSFLLLSRDWIVQNPVFDIAYYFPIYLSDIFLLILLYLYFRNLASNHNIPKIPKYSVFLVLFIGVSLLAIFNGIFPDIAILSAIQLFKLGLVFFLPLILRINKAYIDNTLRVLSAFVIFQAIWILHQHVNSGPLGLDLEVYLPGTEFGITAVENQELYRASGTFFEPNKLGVFMLMHFLLFLSVLVVKKSASRFEKNVVVIATISSFISLILAGSRGVYSLLIVMCFLLVLISKRWLLVKKVYIKTYMLMLVLLLLITLFASSAFLLTRLQSFGSLFGPDGSGTYRVQLNQYALRLSLSNPLGVGLNLSPYFFATFFPQENFIFDPTYPHNIYFQVLAEAGIFGFVFFLLFLVGSFREFILKNDKGPGFPFFAAAFAFAIAANMYPIFIDNPEVFSFFFLYLGLMSYVPVK